MCWETFCPKCLGNPGRWGMAAILHHNATFNTLFIVTVWICFATPPTATTNWFQMIISKIGWHGNWNQCIQYVHHLFTYASGFINTFFQKCAYDSIKRSNTVFLTLSDNMFRSYSAGKKTLSQQYFAAWYIDSNENQLRTIPLIWGRLSQRKWDMRQHKITLTLV